MNTDISIGIKWTFLIYCDDYIYLPARTLTELIYFAQLFTPDPKMAWTDMILTR
jgi:hypothetical protein